MTSYMYNPSKKLTEILSQYLEFDPEELQLGIWSGHLSLQNVHLREEAIYPLLNSHLESSTASSDNQTYANPPLRFKLLSGTIGSFQVKIPWKQLVWGQGDVSVNLRNVVFVVKQESFQETLNRKGKSAEEEPLFPKPEKEVQTETSKEHEADPASADSKSSMKFRERRQKQLREAERRQLQGLPLSSWLEAVKKKEDKMKAKAVAGDDIMKKVIQRETRLYKWISEQTNDFLFRFFAGLKMEVENVKLVVVQDGIEVGLIIPSTKMIAGKDRTIVNAGNNSRPVTSGNLNISHDAGGSYQLSEDAASADTNSAPSLPRNIVYAGEHEDGEHIDKQIRILGLGIYVRKQPILKQQHIARHSPDEHDGDRGGANNDNDKSPSELAQYQQQQFAISVDVSTQDYMVRPVDFDSSFSLFHPYPPEKQKKRKRVTSGTVTSPQPSLVDGSHSVAESSATGSSSKRSRRKKRDRGPLPTGSATDSLTTDKVSDFSTPQPLPKNTTPSRHRRLSSNISYSSAFAGSVATASGAVRHKGNSQLVPSSDLRGSCRAAAISDNRSLQTRFDGKLSIGAVQMVCSTRHYELFNAFLAGNAKLRNGRPNRTIQSVLVEGLPKRHSFILANPKATDISESSSHDFLHLSLDLDGLRPERSKVIRSWWRYVLTVIVWEIRERKRLRRKFQEQFLSFNWSQQRYRRKEYVDLYISNRLRAGAIGLHLLSSESQEEKQFLIEDELPIEQILLYRAIARDVVVRGGKKMPGSILEIYAEDRAGRAITQSEPKSPHATKDADQPPEYSANTEDNTGILSALENKCKIARRRRDAKDGEVLEDYERSSPWSHFPSSPSRDADGLFTNLEDSTIRTFRTAKSKQSITEEQEPTSTGMLSSFAVDLEKLEFMIVEEENLFDGYTDPYDQLPSNRPMDNSGSGPGSDSSANASDVSGLTDDDPLFGAGDSPSDHNFDENEMKDELILASTDYLLFQMPQKVILCMKVNSLGCSAFVDNGGSRNLNFNIGTIDITGDNGCRLLSVGRPVSEEAPVHEVKLVKNLPQVPQTNKKTNNRGPIEAVSLSVSIQNGAVMLQSDISTLKGRLDLQTMDKLIAFSVQTPVRFPEPVLPRSPNEEVRLYVLSQNDMSPMLSISCSVRLNGCEILIPSDLVDEPELEDFSFASSHGSNLAVSETGTLLRTEMIEIYSGVELEALGNATSGWSQPDSGLTTTGESVTWLDQGQPIPIVRALRMLDISEISLKTGSPFSHQFVLAINGLDCNVSSKLLNGEALSRGPSLFQSSVDMELLCTANKNSVLDSSCAAFEIAVEVSPVHILASESRVVGLSEVLPSLMRHSDAQSPPTKVEIGPLPPRLEILSRFLRCTLDINIGRVRLSFISGERKDLQSAKTKQVEMEQSLADFLSVVSSFDLSFPHEEALSSAMQICIDRVTGLGLVLEESWEATNTALLNFLEDIAEMRREKSQEEPNSESDPSIMLDGAPVSQEEELVRNTLWRSVERTVALYTHRLEREDQEHDFVNDDLVLDLPDGVSVSSAQCYYDSYHSFVIPTIFVKNSAGVHIVNVTPKDDTEGDVEDNEVDSDKVETDNPSRISGNTAVGFCIFETDKEYPFGRGGLPLSILGSDAESPGNNFGRTKEILNDVVLSEFEVLFSQQIMDSALQVVARVLAPLHEVEFPSSPEGANEVENPMSRFDFHVLVAGQSISLLFVSDDLFPFSRLQVKDIVTRTRSSSSAASIPSTTVSALSLDLLNLTPEGEVYPVTLSHLTDSRGLPLLVNFSSSKLGSKLDVELKGFQLFFLYQFLNECLQYFLSGKYGFGLFIQSLSELQKNDDTKDDMVDSNGDCTGESTFTFKVSIYDSSIIIPRSSSSSDMISLEVDAFHLSSEELLESFTLPTSTCPLTVPGSIRAPEPDFKDSFDGDHNMLDYETNGSISRLQIKLQGVHIFTSLSEAPPSQAVVESRSFRYFYSIDGRAEANVPVYRRNITNEGRVAEDEAALCEDEKSQRRWREITRDPLSLDILVDSAPLLRILICDPLNTTAPNKLDLDITQAQFSLLLSLWFSNMQELPMMFPFSAAEVEAQTRPQFDPDFPEYGTEEFISRLSDVSMISTEFAIVLDCLQLRCTESLDSSVLDRRNDEFAGIRIAFRKCAIHITSDRYSTSRIGVGSHSVSLVDESKTFDQVISLAGESNRSWADLSFGLNFTSENLSKTLPQAFQLGIFMTDTVSMYSLGMDTAQITISNLSTVFKLLQFLSGYFTDPSSGNPFFEAEDRAKKMKAELKKDIGHDDLPSASGSITDFRLWLIRPRICIPCNAFNRSAPGLRLESEEGLWYRFNSIDTYASQEVVSRGLCLIYDDKCVNLQQILDSEATQRYLVEGLSFGLRLGTNYSVNHTDISLQIPFVDPKACSITSQRISIFPTELPAPTICLPPGHADRFLGPTVCEMTCIIDILPQVSAAILNLLATDSSSASAEDMDEENTSGTTTHDVEPQIGEIDEEDASQSEQNKEDSPTNVDEKGPEATSSFVGTIGDLRIFALDPVLGAHLPVAVLSISRISITASQFATAKQIIAVARGESPPEDLQILVEGHFWADYFKLGLTRSWEPLLEAYKFSILYEKSRFRGSGLSLNSVLPLHLNVSGALLQLLDEVLDLYQGLIRETFGSNPSNEKLSDTTPIVKDRVLVHDCVEGKDIIQEMVTPLDKDDRVPFSLQNMTGQKIRVYRIDDEMTTTSAVVTYLEQSHSTKLSFLPSISTVRNMSVVEVSYPGLPNSPRQTHLVHDQFSYNRKACGQRDIDSVQEVDAQLPGFRWLRGIKVDIFGRSFERIVPRSKDVLFKTAEDWRLGNTLNLVSEVAIDNGGRKVILRSLFSVVNNTTHTISLLLNPDPTFKPKERGKIEKSQRQKCDESLNEDDTNLVPGGIYQVPTLLLESALRQVGSHLGSIWIKPNIDSSRAPILESFLASNEVDDSVGVCVDFSSRPVQLTRMVNESAIMFESGNGSSIPSDAAKSGDQLSCPVIQDSGNRLAPFCYAVEVGRSPLVKARVRNKNEKERSRMIHGPVAYTLSIHPPLILVNLLPERGRFELMHAVRKNVMWFADLEPGEQISIHSVGLDAPLLLLLNLGFCRTPVGEGALIHHGVDHPAGIRENITIHGLKSIGKAGKAVTRQVGKALTSIGDSPDRRGVEKVFQITKNQKYNTDAKGRRLRKNTKFDFGLDTGLSGTDKVSGKTYVIDDTTFFPDDVAAETTVVDSIGQRLTLSIENFRGGGGQRRISVFCPYWIVNTTEHSLRYRQHKRKNYVSGTVLSPTMDGSLPLSGGRARAKYRVPDEKITRSVRFNRPLNKGTIFSGTPGALATSPGRCELSPEQLAPLIDKNIGLEKLARLAFMFNFHEGILKIGHQNLCVKLGDGTGATEYESDWSRGFSLDSVGFSQVVAMNCKDGRALEVSVVVNVAPGFLSGYTKIVRILPRFVVFNNLSHPIRIWQDSSVFRLQTHYQDSGNGDASAKDRKWRMLSQKAKHDPRRVNQYEALWGREARLDESAVDGIAPVTTAHRSALYIATISDSGLIPFNLPDSRGDRQIRIDTGGKWNLSASFSADVPGDYTLKISRDLDSMMMSHVSTRASSHYEVKIYPSDLEQSQAELGVWFETEWGSDRSLIVKAVKKDSFAFNQTDIHVGDELLFLDGVPVSRMSFSEAMNNLRDRLNEFQAGDNPSRRMLRRTSLNLRLGSRMKNNLPSDEVTPDLHPLVLKFRTVEERLCRVRQKAASTALTSQIAGQAGTDPPNQSEENTDLSFYYVKAELRILHHSVFLVLRDIDEEKFPVPYLIQNRTINSIIYFRQQRCNGHQWLSLRPGQSTSYSWEEPMNPRKLMVRVSNESVFLSKKDIEPENLFQLSSAQFEQSKKKIPFLKVDDEEDKAFSPSIGVRLDEIGSQKFLPCSMDKGSVSTHFLKMNVDVVGRRRNLVVDDLSVCDEEVEQQMLRHLASLEEKCREEEQRKMDLETLKIRLDEGNMPADGIAEGAKALMLDYPEESTMTGKHQLVVEVLEAVGLSPEGFAESCNPYAEIYLKSATDGRKRLFRKKDSRRTYFIKKTLNPVWISQSFLFRVPAAAAQIPRGHSVRIRIRNYRTIGENQLLGKVGIDLHSLRNQAPIVGWFPLATRTSRRELENPLTRWGRGSVKLRVQWVYELPALLEYYSLLSQSRLKELKESAKGMAKLLDEKKEADKKKMEGVDGFKAVRVRDLLSLPRPKAKINERRFQSPILKSEDKDYTKKKPPSTQRFLRKPRSLRKQLNYKDRSSLQKDLRQTTPRRSLEAGDARRLSTRSSRPLSPISMNSLESRISQQRQNVISSFKSKRWELLRSTLFLQPNYSKTIVVSSFKSKVAVQALFKDADLDITVVEKGIQIKIRRKEAIPNAKVEKGPESQRLVEKKLALPSSSPSKVTAVAWEYASAFLKSRISFERASKMNLNAVLNPGGWLTIRPITALNLPDSYPGMFVKLCFGSEILNSETVDARVSPTWYKPNPRMDNRRDGSASLDSRAKSLDFSPNDLHIQVSPQSTSGSIQISVIGTKEHQQINAKTELGVLHLSLGRAITACIDCIDQHLDSNPTDASSVTPMYTRWFKLMDPKDALPVEGDCGNSFLPSETEKISDDNFQEYFAPCIQLALMWWPDLEDDGGLSNDEENNIVPQHVQRSRLSDHPSSANSAENSLRTVESYFNADIGCISAALIDSNKAIELLSFRARDIDVRYWVTNAKTRTGVTVGELQLDHQDENAREPVIFARTPVEQIVPVIQILVVKNNIKSKTGVLSFDFIDINIEEFDLAVEENFLFDLLDFINSVNMRRLSRAKRMKGSQRHLNKEIMFEKTSLINNDAPAEEPSLLNLLEIERQTDGENQIYIEQLFLGAIKVNLSYLKGSQTYDYLLASQRNFEQTLTGLVAPKLHEKCDVFTAWSQHTYDEDRLAEDQGTEAQKLSSMLALLIPNVSDAPVRLQGRWLNHLLMSPSEIFQNIKNHYVNMTLKQIYIIIGSSDYLMNTGTMFTSIMSGVRDLYTTPTEEFAKDPSRVPVGVAKGTISFCSHFASSILQFSSKLFANVGYAGAILTLDEEFVVWQRDNVRQPAMNMNRAWKRQGVERCNVIILKPITAICRGIVSGVSGIVVSPIKGYHRNGTIGVVQGVGQGILGLPLKPTIGVFDALTHLSSSLYTVVKSANVLDKRFQPATKLRLPYTFALMNILTPFDTPSARAAQFLKQFPPPKRFRQASASSRNEILVHVEILPNIGSDTYAMVTSIRMILIKVKKERTGILVPSLCWEVVLIDDALVSCRVSDHGHNGVALTITLAKPTKNEESDTGSTLRESEPAVARSIGLASPEPQLSNVGVDGISLENREDFNHRCGTSRGEAGELLEWYTVLAEYQYRQQLARLSNAISCLVGDFDAIMYDPSFGRKGGTQGYTSFGIFYFEKEKPQEHCSEYEELSFPPELELLPWLNENSFGENKNKTPSEQEAYLVQQRDNWDFSRELEASRRNGGPEWLIMARAKAVFIDKCDEMPLQMNIFEESKEQLERRNELRAQRSDKEIFMSAVSHFDSPFDDCDTSESLGRDSPALGEPLQSNSLRVSFKDAIQSFGSSCSSAANSSSDGGRISPVHGDQPSDRRFNSWTTCESISNLSQNSSRSSSSNLSQNSSDQRSRPALQLHDVSSSAQTDQPVPETMTASQISNVTGSTELAQVSGIPPHSGAIETTRIQGPHQTSGWIPGYDAGTSYVHPPPPPSQHEARMERMEALMEQLLIFNTEQALANRIPPAGLSRPNALGNVTEPKEEAVVPPQGGQVGNNSNSNNNNTTGQESSKVNEEISTLRQEVAALREQIALNNNNEASTEKHHHQSTEDVIETID